MRTPEPGNIDRGTSSRGTWRSNGNFRSTSRSTSPTSAPRVMAATAISTSMRRTVIGSGNAGRPYASFGRNIAIGSWGQRLRTRYHSLQTSVNRPFTKGLLLKGAYTWGKAMNESQNDEDGWTRRCSSTARASPSQLCARRLRSHAQLPARIPVSAAVAERGRRIRQYREGDHQRLAGEWRARHLQRRAVHADREWRVVNTPSNQQTPELIGTHVGNIGASGTYYDLAAFAAPTGVISATWAAARSAVLAARTWISRSSARSRWGSAPPRIPGGSVQPDEYADVRQSGERHHDDQLHAHHGRQQRRRCAELSRTADPARCEVRVLTRLPSALG